MKSARHTLFKGCLSDAPGRNESWTESLEFLGKRGWRLTSEGTDFSGLSAGNTIAERFSSSKLIEWVLERDSEDREAASRTHTPNGEADDETQPGRTLGTRAERLLEIANLVGAEFCARRLRQWEACEWPKDPRPPRILAIRGAVKRWVWKGIGHPVYSAETTLGPAYLYPPSPERTCRLLLKSSESHAPGWTLRVPKTLLSELEQFTPDFRKLELEKSA